MTRTCPFGRKLADPPPLRVTVRPGARRLFTPPRLLALYPPRLPEGFLPRLPADVPVRLPGFPGVFPRRLSDMFPPRLPSRVYPPGRIATATSGVPGATIRSAGRPSRLNSRGTPLAARAFVAGASCVTGRARHGPGRHCALDFPHAHPALLIPNRAVPTPAPKTLPARKTEMTFVERCGYG